MSGDGELVLIGRDEATGWDIVRQGDLLLYRVERFKNNGESYFELRNLAGRRGGSGVASLGEVAEAGRAAQKRLKSDRREAYEERVLAALDQVAGLQESVIGMASDPECRVDALEAGKIRLGLQAADSILNRALGKPVTRIDAEITQNVAEEMMSIAEGWSIVEEDEGE